MMDTAILAITRTCGILSPLTGIICLLIAVLRSPWFHWTEEELSVFGVNSSSAIFFNTGLALTGLFSLIFTLGLIKNIPAYSIINFAGVFLLASGSIAFAIIGLIPRSNPVPHYMATGSFFILVPAGILLIGIYLLKSSNNFLGIASLTTSILMVFFHLFPWWPWRGGAIPQLLSSLMWGLWMIISAVVLK